MHRAETVVLKLRSPGRAKRAWLEGTAERFRQGTQLGLDYALGTQTSDRGKIHAATYPKIRALGLPSDYCRMAVNQAVQLSRSHFSLRKSQRRAGKPTVVRSQGIGLGTNAYQVVGTALRLSTGVQGDYIWLPLCVPPPMAGQVAVRQRRCPAVPAGRRLVRDAAPQDAHRPYRP